MNRNKEHLFLVAGLCGISGVLSYVAAIAAPLPDLLLYPIAILFPLLLIVYAYGLYELIATERQSTANRLGFIMATIAFAILAQMISVQLAVRIGTDEISAVSQSPDIWPSILRATRLVDMGLDVAWDIFIGTALVITAIPMRRHSVFGQWWAVPSGVLGILLVVLNVATFPWPPNTRGSFDVGPFVGLFVILLSIRMIVKRKTVIDDRTPSISQKS